MSEVSLGGSGGSQTDVGGATSRAERAERLVSAREETVALLTEIESLQKELKEVRAKEQQAYRRVQDDISGHKVEAAASKRAEEEFRTEIEATNRRVRIGKSTRQKTGSAEAERFRKEVDSLRTTLKTVERKEIEWKHKATEQSRVVRGQLEIKEEALIEKLHAKSRKMEKEIAKYQAKKESGVRNQACYEAIIADMSMLAISPSRLQDTITEIDRQKEKSKQNMEKAKAERDEVEAKLKGEVEFFRTRVEGLEARETAEAQQLAEEAAVLWSIAQENIKVAAEAQRHELEQSLKDKGEVAKLEDELTVLLESAMEESSLIATETAAIEKQWSEEKPILTAKLEKLRRKGTLAREEATRAFAMVDKAREEAEGLEDKIAETQAELQAVRERGALLRKKLEADAQARAQALRVRIEQVTQQCEAERKQLTEELANFKAEVKALGKRLTILKRDNTDLAMGTGVLSRDLLAAYELQSLRHERDDALMALTKMFPQPTMLQALLSQWAEERMATARRLLPAFGVTDLGGSQELIGSVGTVRALRGASLSATAPACLFSHQTSSSANQDSGDGKGDASADGCQDEGGRRGSVQTPERSGQKPPIHKGSPRTGPDKNKDGGREEEEGDGRADALPPLERKQRSNEQHCLASQLKQADAKLLRMMMKIQQREAREPVRLARFATKKRG
mmetsp:Transcript_27195/g.62697  ORF Transcript_27195/g.62697 Transcript_27195/m.62697 type:complete len:682 (-) Transcript_27195:356-2401(-)